MTPPDVWTSEPPSEPGWYWLQLRSDKEPRPCYVTVPACWIEGDRRSAHRIASAERAAALEELASASLTYFGLHQRTDIDGGDVLAAHDAMLAAISRLEACR